jgi:hypothetical protein
MCWETRVCVISAKAMDGSVGLIQRVDVLLSFAREKCIYSAQGFTMGLIIG